MLLRNMIQEEYKCRCWIYSEVSDYQQVSIIWPYKHIAILLKRKRKQKTQWFCLDLQSTYMPDIRHIVYDYISIIISMKAILNLLYKTRFLEKNPDLLKWNWFYQMISSQITFQANAHTNASWTYFCNDREVLHSIPVWFVDVSQCLGQPLGRVMHGCEKNRKL